MVWLVWFNAGSALGANGLAASAVVTTTVAAGAAILGWAFVDYIRHRKVTSLGAVSGVVAGHAATRGRFVSPISYNNRPRWLAMICAYAVGVKLKFGYDDALDVVGARRRWRSGRIAGFLAETAVNPGGADGVFYGGGWGCYGTRWWPWRCL